MAALATGRPATATELSVRLPITGQAIAKHLALLADAGLVTAEPASGAGSLPAHSARCRSRSSSWPPWPATGTARSARQGVPGPRGGTRDMKTPLIVTRRNGRRRASTLVKEKELTRARDALAAERRRMPWLAVTKPYAFDGPHGRASLRDLFEQRLQLVVYLAFFEPDVLGWPEHALHGCSMMTSVCARSPSDARDTTFAYASRAPHTDIARPNQRMGSTMPWYRSPSTGTPTSARTSTTARRVLPRRRPGFRTYSSTTAATRRSRHRSYLDLTRSGGRRRGRTPPTVTRRPRRTTGGTGTTNTTTPSWPRAR